MADIEIAPDGPDVKKENLTEGQKEVATEELDELKNKVNTKTGMKKLKKILQDDVKTEFVDVKGGQQAPVEVPQEKKVNYVFNPSDTKTERTVDKVLKTKEKVPEVKKPNVLRELFRAILKSLGVKMEDDDIENGTKSPLKMKIVKPQQAPAPAEGIVADEVQVPVKPESDGGEAGQLDSIAHPAEPEPDSTPLIEDAAPVTRPREELQNPMSATTIGQRPESDGARLEVQGRFAA